jgi:membrane protein YqaA with SNARE-associated domain
MKRLVTGIQAFAMGIGGPGLFVIAFLDSSILSLPEINDILIIWMVTQHPHRMAYYAAMATGGSISGCFLLYYLGRKGGDAFLRKRFHARRLDRAMQLFRRYGVLAIVVPAILPPPAPFKIFVLMAGVAKVPTLQFALAIAAGRGFRYFAEGLLAVWYGAQAIEYLRANGKTVSIVLAALVLAGGVAYYGWRRRMALRRAG